MGTAVVLFTRDLRVHDQPALAAAARAERVVPLFVFDERILGTAFAPPNKVGFLIESLVDLDRSLGELGGGLVTRRGSVVREAVTLAAQVGAETLFVSEDVSAYAQERQRLLGEACRERGIELVLAPGITVVPPGAVAPASGGSHYYRVFSPFWRHWERTELRAVEPVPERVPLPEGLERGLLPEPGELAPGERAPAAAPGGETEGRALARRWYQDGLRHYGARRGDLGSEGVSRLAPYLHFGCVSPLELVRVARGRPGADAWIRQLCWRDFYHHLLAADPELPRVDFRDRGDAFREDPSGLAAWKEGRTGYPIVDAGMRQLLHEGYMHNRARLITASFLTKHLYIDWRAGAEHYYAHLTCGNVASNVGNWQWVAGTGVDTRQYRVYNPTLQAQRHDAGGDYVRRYVPELAGIEGKAVHEPWKLDAATRTGLDYPEPIVEHLEAVRRFREARRKD